MKFNLNPTILRVLIVPLLLGVFMFLGRPEINPARAYQQPYVKNLIDFSVFGYSPLGQSMSSLMVWGYWQTVAVAILGRGLALSLSFAGLFLAWHGMIPGILKNHQIGFFWMNRFSEAFMTIPSLLLALSLGYLIGDGFSTMILVIGISEWAFNQKWLLGRLKEYRRYPFIEASEAMGGSRFHIFSRHFVPFIFSDLTFLFFLYLPGSLLTVTALEFLGLSSGSEIAGLGSLIALNKDLIFLYPHVILPPVFLIVITIYITVIIKNEVKAV